MASKNADFLHTDMSPRPTAITEDTLLALAASIRLEQTRHKHRRLRRQVSRLGTSAVSIAKQALSLNNRLTADQVLKVIADRVVPATKTKPTTTVISVASVLRHEQTSHVMEPAKSRMAKFLTGQIGG